MRFVRSLPALLMLSLCCGAGLLALGMAFTPVAWQGGYTVLICDEHASGREIQEGLENQGFTGIIAESSQWALLDGFGTLERIPLDEYANRIVPFDPRNDGYAERLRSFFVRDGRRYVFIPRTASPVAAFTKRIAAAMGDIPYSIKHLGLGTPQGLFLLFFGLAAFGFFFACLLRIEGRYTTAYLVPCMPVLAPLALAGAPGLALIALLAGVSALLADPCMEFLALLRRLRHSQRDAPFKIGQLRALFFRDIYEPYRPCLLLSALLLICYGFGAVFLKITPVFAALVFIAYAGVLICAFWRFFLQGAGHRHFSPLPIIRQQRVFSPDCFRLMLPFALAALGAALAGAFFTVSASSELAALFPAEGLITGAEYRAHVRFQSTFSLRPLGRNSAYPEQAAYLLDADGLVSPVPSPERWSGGEDGNGLETAEEPPDTAAPLPLMRLMALLEAAGSRSGGGVGRRVPPAGELLLTLLPLVFVAALFVLRFPPKKKKAVAGLFSPRVSRASFRRRGVGAA